MRTPQKRLVSALLIFALAGMFLTAAASPVPEKLPEDLGGKTLYGYLTELKTTYAPLKVFSDAVKYSDADRDNARRALRLIVDAATQKMDSAGAADQYNLYLRAYAYDLLFQDSKDPALREQALADYLKTVELGGGYAQADHDRLAAMDVQAAPLKWQVPQMLTPREAGEIMGIGGDGVFLIKSLYQTADMSRLGAGYAILSLSNPTESAVFVLADPQGGKARYDALKRQAFLGQVKDIQGLGSEAVAIGLRNIGNDPLLYSTVLVLKDSLVLQVRVPDYVWRGPGFNADPIQLATRLAEKFLSNLFDASRAVQGMESFVLEDLMPRREFDPGQPDSPVPGEIPQDLGGKTVYGYLVGLRSDYLPKDVFQDAKYSQTERNNARRALRLIADTISQGFDLNGPNPYELEIRGACYSLAFQDTRDPAWRALAVNDYKQALSGGYVPVKADYDRLTTPLLADMAELSKGASGAMVLRLQGWLTKAGFLKEHASGEYDSATQSAVEAFEKVASLTPDGIADIACVLALYARIDDGDALYFSK